MDYQAATLPYNYVLLCALVAWACAQAAKVLLILLTEHRFDKERLFGAGGMPSSHSATVCALALAVCRVCGLGSAEFAIAVVLAAVVMYDATGVRRSSGEQAKLLNRMVDLLDLPELKQKEISKKLHMFSKTSELFEDAEEEDEEIKRLKEKLGHTPMEVLGGALLGIVVSLLIPV